MEDKGNLREPFVSPDVEPGWIPSTIPTLSNLNSLHQYGEDMLTKTKEFLFRFENSKRFLERENTLAKPPSLDERKITRATSTLLRNLYGGSQEERDSASFLAAFQALCLYLTLGFGVFYFFNAEFGGVKTNKVVDSLYFSVVTLTTVGYGDIAPNGSFGKLFTCLFVFSGFFVVDKLLTTASEYLSQIQVKFVDHALRAEVDNTLSPFSFWHILLKVIPFYRYLKAKDDRFYRLSLEFHAQEAWQIVFSAAIRVVIIILAGSLVLHFVEGLPAVDAFYCACVTVTTVGYGDRSFSTLQGRIFAVLWILSSTVAVSHFFLCLAEARVTEKHLELTKRVLRGRISKSDFNEFDVDGDGRVSLAEFALFKLKELGRLNECDILAICREYESLDANNDGQLDEEDLAA